MAGAGAGPDSKTSRGDPESVGRFVVAGNWLVRSSVQTDAVIYVGSTG